jgi:hypothetical protein
MIGHRPLVRYVLALLTALPTVWCLGCCAYEPLVESLLDGGAAPRIACEQDGMSGSGATGVSERGPGAGQAAVVSVNASQQTPAQVECQCLSCIAPSPAHVVALVLPPVSPAVLPATITVPASVSRAPLVPPPVALT